MIKQEISFTDFSYILPPFYRPISILLYYSMPERKSLHFPIKTKKIFLTAEKNDLDKYPLGVYTDNT